MRSKNMDLTTRQMFVVKRNGEREPVMFEKVVERIRKLSEELTVCPEVIAQRVLTEIYDGVPTRDLDTLATLTCVSYSTENPDYATLAGRIEVSSLHKETTENFTELMGRLQNFKDKLGNDAPKISEEVYTLSQKQGAEIAATIRQDRDYLIDYFGVKTLARAYLNKIDGTIVERPQHMWMRVALGIHGDDWENVAATQNDMSQKYYTHATPTLFNAGTPRPQMASCFLVAMKDDSIDGIQKTAHECALISKWGGGVGLHCHNIRAKGSYIRGTSGTSNGITPMLRVFNATARQCDQGGGKRKGSFAIYMEPWHADIFDFLELKLNFGNEEDRARDLFQALWVPDLFMKRVEADGMWSLMCPDNSPGLADVQGADFEELYEKYEAEGRYIRQISARKLWQKILDIQVETGTPYILQKDAANRKSNQRNLGVIKSSNLCVAPETKVLTDNGHQKIADICGKSVRVWNGEEWSEVDVFKTGTNQELMEVRTSDGGEIVCTPYHKFFIQYSQSKSSIRKVDAKDLKKGDKIIKSEFPIIDGSETFLYPYTHGFFCGDGTQTNNHLDETPCEYNAITGHHFCKRHIDFETENYKRQSGISLNDYTGKCKAFSGKKKPHVWLYGDKRNLVDYIEHRGNINGDDERISLSLPLDINDKYEVPGEMCSIKTKLDWFAGQCDADGTISKNGDNSQLQICSVNLDFLKKVRLMLQTCGIQPKISSGLERGDCILPDGKGGSKLFNVQTTYRMLITSWDLYRLTELGFSPKRLVYPVRKPTRNSRQFIKVMSTSFLDRRDDTYCFTEPKRHMGVFNGILTGQCTEIIEYSNAEETAVCNLASINLQAFINRPPISNDAEITVFTKEGCVHCAILKSYMDEWGISARWVSGPENAEERLAFQTEARCQEPRTYPMVYVREEKEGDLKQVGGAKEFIEVYAAPHYDYESLRQKTAQLVLNLNRVIDRSQYPTAGTRLSNMRHRPIGLGVQGLADVFARMRAPFDSVRAYEMNRRIFANIYQAALEASAELSRVEGTQETFEGSPASEGIIQPDLWDGADKLDKEVPDLDWGRLRELVRGGLRNSLLVAPMPTASTSQILGNNECFEPFQNNIFTRRVLAGEFIIVNKYLVRDLVALGLWNGDMKDRIIAANGSVADITEIPGFVKSLYPTIWEMKMRTLIDMAAERGRFICQSQSLNLFIASPTRKTLTSMHFQAWKKGLKTGIYQLRTKPKADAQKFSLDASKDVARLRNRGEGAGAGELQNLVAEPEGEEEGCLMCSA